MSVNRTKKSLVALLVGAPLSLSLVACGASADSEGDTTADGSTVTSTTAAPASEKSETAASSESSAESEASAADDKETAGDEEAAGTKDKSPAGEKPAPGAKSAPSGTSVALSDTAPDVRAEGTTGDPAAAAEVESAVRNQFDSAHYANMATLWDHTQRSTCAPALQASQQEAKAMMAQELPEMQGMDVFALMEDPNVGPVVREQLVNQPAPPAPTLNSIRSINVDGDQATAQVNSTTDGQAGDQTLTFANEGGTWKVCG
ncbi:hypothetical protein [Corynebacterium guangdongense]|uniref:Secreted protein n=1 Tax=Corynebacterium guangdongense TaxID=1783348 RepID=A0ABU1ZXP0_9CORY|nr:hypothetical protein [Corynebacterium guangdongense]MDR7329693.1 hypothetical protein [Corynebacterium guangdongense]